MNLMSHSCDRFFSALGGVEVSRSQYVVRRNVWSEILFRSHTLGRVRWTGYAQSLPAERCTYPTCRFVVHRLQSGSRKRHATAKSTSTLAAIKPRVKANVEMCPPIFYSSRCPPSPTKKYTFSGRTPFAANCATTVPLNLPLSRR